MSGVENLPGVNQAHYHPPLPDDFFAAKAEIATISVADVERLMQQRDDARALCVALEAVCAEREALLWLAIGTPMSHATAEEIGRQIAAHLRESGSQPPSVTS